MTTGPLNELQLSLIAAGFIAVVGVWGYNFWQERKHRQLAQRVFGGEQSDVLMRGEGKDRTKNDADAEKLSNDMPEIREPLPVDVDAVDAVAVDDSISVARTNGFAGVQERIEPVFISNDEDVSVEMPREEVPDTVAQIPAPPVDHQPTAIAIESTTIVDNVESVDNADDRMLDSEPPLELADSLVDCIVSFDAADLVSAPLFWSAQRQLMGRLAGRLRWSGLDENNGQWKLLHAHDATSYRRLVAALQIADRSGPVNAADLMLFCNSVRQLATHYQAQVVVPVEADVLAHAMSLDEFCASVDWRLGINLVHRDGLGISLAGLKQLADSAALRLDDKGIFYARDDAGQVIFTMSNIGGAPFVFDDEISPTTSGVTLTIDVPLVTDGCAAFDRMLNLARLVVVALDAVMVDDQRVKLSDEVIALIRTKIGEFQRKMADHKIPAGGRRALRLYS